MEFRNKQKGFSLVLVKLAEQLNLKFFAAGRFGKNLQHFQLFALLHNYCMLDQPVSCLDCR